MKIRQHILSPLFIHVLMLSFLVSVGAVLASGALGSLRLAENAVRGSLKVVLLLQPDTADDAAKQWADTLVTQDAEIESVSFISKAEALEKAQSNPALVKSLILLRENPLPSSVIIRYKDRAWLERPEPTTGFQNAPFVQEARWDAERRSSFQAIRRWRSAVVLITAVSGAILFVWAVMGLYRNFANPQSRAEVIVTLGAGLLGGTLAIGLLLFSLRGSDNDVLLFKPVLFTPWPWLAGLFASASTFSGKEAHES